MKHGKCLAHPLSYPVSCHHQFKRLRSTTEPSRLFLLAGESLGFKRSMLWITVSARVERMDNKHNSALSLRTKAARSAALCVWERERERERETKTENWAETEIQSREGIVTNLWVRVLYDWKHLKITSGINTLCLHDWDQNRSAV